MARRPDDPRVADLRRYRKARELEQRRRRASASPERFLGSRPRAGLILAAVVILLALVSILPALR